MNEVYLLSCVYLSFIYIFTNIHDFIYEVTALNVFMKEFQETVNLLNFTLLQKRKRFL